MPTPHPTVRPLFTGLSPWLQLLLTLVLVMAGFQFVGMFFGLLAALPLYEGSLEQLLPALANPTADPAMRPVLLVMQGVAALCGFLLTPWLLVRYLYGGSLRQLAPRPPQATAVLLTFGITLFFMGVNAPIIEWNQHLVLPWPEAERLLRGLEDTLARTSEFITRFGSPAQLLLGLVVIAVIPGIGEELVFRGLVQNHLYRLAGNIHLAVWGGALLFSLFHLQFYGLVPRMLLGALFGYLYYFSGNILYAMAAHFFNNAFTLVMLHLYHQGAVEYNIEETGGVAWHQVLVAAIITAVLIFAFLQQTRAANGRLDKNF